MSQLEFVWAKNNYYRSTLKVLDHTICWACLTISPQSILGLSPNSQQTVVVEIYCNARSGGGLINFSIYWILFIRFFTKKKLRSRGWLIKWRQTMSNWFLDLAKNVLNNLFFQSLVGMYVLTVVFLVRRRLMMVVREEMVTVVMTDEKGETIIRDVETALDDKEKILLWTNQFCM